MKVNIAVYVFHDSGALVYSHYSLFSCYSFVRAGYMAWHNVLLFTNTILYRSSFSRLEALTVIKFCFIFSPPLRSDRGRLSRLLFFPLFLFFFYVAMVWKGKPASVTTGSGDRTYVRK